MYPCSSFQVVRVCHPNNVRIGLSSYERKTENSAAVEICVFSSKPPKCDSVFQTCTTSQIAQYGFAFFTAGG